ncbi:MAG: 3-oxoacyl-ACP reductase FabG [Bacteroidales bacterium]|jgi:3-oxoacyl-[acyl-carrier protein] reductase|nr:3-oxoacyl-ACP reductase FabG [Bacteroidales bacterium]MBQ6741818.1 3-oxoacyl-ACP reductase FabG [Bacteroidales bacterium]
MEYALITGASRGLGKAIAERLAKEGYAVIVNYNNSEKAAIETVENIEAAGGKAELMKLDVKEGSQVDAAIEAWEAAHPEDYIAVLVNNAGVREDSLLVFMQDEQWDKVMETTLGGFFYLTRRVVKNMMTHRNGRIVNISSVSGLTGMQGQCNYAAAKAGLIGASKALALEVAPRKVTVNVVAPGFIATDMTSELDQDMIKKTVPLGRIGKPEEVAALVAFLASKEAAYITGQVISINGGVC